MSKYAKIISTTTQKEKPIDKSEMIKNNAGGYVFQISDEQRLKRFLILGSEGGTFYVDERKLTIDNAQTVISMIKNKGDAVLDILKNVCENRLAPKVSPSIFVYGLIFIFGDEQLKSKARLLKNLVLQTAEHLFEFCDVVRTASSKKKSFGKSLRKLISSWYNERNDLGYQISKYRNRETWTHKKLLRMSHVIPKNEEINRLFKWAVGKEKFKEDDLEKSKNFVHPYCVDKLVEIRQNFQIKLKENKVEYFDVFNFIEKYKLTWEMVPSNLLTAEVWEQLLYNLPLTALLKNLGQLSSKNIFAVNKTKNIDHVLKILNDEEYIKKYKLHPINILNTFKVYKRGRAFKGQLTWKPNTDILDALENIFYKSFSNIEPINKKLLVGLDVSGSMLNNACCGMKSLDCATVCLCLGLLWKKIEGSNCIIKAFSEELMDFPIKANDNLNDIFRKVKSIPFSRTDCSLPMRYALHEKLFVDCFIIVTDNETWYGDEHPYVSLQKYRNTINNNAKLIVMALDGTKFSIADLNDKGSLDIAGINSSVPDLIRNFILDEI